MAVDLPPILATIDNAIKTVQGVTVFGGYVPDDLPTDSGGYVLPYVVEWFGTGANPDEPQLSGLHDTDSLILDFQITSVGANPTICRAVDIALNAALVNLPAGTGRVKPNPDGFNQQTPIHDTQARPARFFLPSQWRLQTN